MFLPKFEKLMQKNTRESKITCFSEVLKLDANKFASFLEESEKQWYQGISVTLFFTSLNML
jgi:hypothetical protein